MTRSPPSRALPLAALSLFLAAAPNAFGQAAAQQRATAQAAFDDAMKLMREGRTAEACPKFEAALRLDGGMATQFRLAECYDKLGQLASAWANYVEVADAAKAAKNKDREALARKRAAALEPRLSRLTILVAPAVAALQGLEIKRDGSAVDKALWGTAVPVDPGEHRVVATAPGKKPWEGKGVATDQATKIEVTIPPLEDLRSPPLVAPPEPPAASAPASVPASVPASAPASPPPEGGGRSAVPAFLLGGLAVASAGIGVTLVVLSRNKRAEVLELNSTLAMEGGSCSGAPMDPRCEDIERGARAVDTLQNGAIGAFIGMGVLAAGTLTYILWPAPKAKSVSSPTLRVVPVIGAGQGGLVVSGAF